MLRMEFKGRMLEQAGVPGALGRRVAEAGTWLRRTVGEMLREMPKQHGARPDRLHDATEPPTYADLGIEKTYAHRCQKLATVSEEKLRGKIEELKADPNGEITMASILRLGGTSLPGKRSRGRRKHSGCRCWGGSRKRLLGVGC